MIRNHKENQHSRERLSEPGVVLIPGRSKVESITLRSSNRGYGTERVPCGGATEGRGQWSQPTG